MFIPIKKYATIKTKYGGYPMKKVLIFIEDDFNDKELPFVSTALNMASDVNVSFASLDKKEITSLGNLHITVDEMLEDAFNKEYDMLILIGGYFYKKYNYHDDRLEGVVQDFFDKQKYVAAIGEAVYFLANYGKLNESTHTANDPDELYNFEPNYRGFSYREDRLASFENNIITAKSCAYNEFTFKIFEALNIDTDLIND